MMDKKPEHANELETVFLNAALEILARNRNSHLPIKLIKSQPVEMNQGEDQIDMYNIIMMVPSIAEVHVTEAVQTMMETIKAGVQSKTTH